MLKLYSKLCFQKPIYKLDIISVVILAGGYDRDQYGGNKYDTIMEYDITGDSIRKIGKMREKRDSHAVSVVSLRTSPNGGCAPD